MKPNLKPLQAHNKRQSFAMNKIQSGPVQLKKNPFTPGNMSLISANLLPKKANKIE